MIDRIGSRVPQRGTAVSRMLARRLLGLVGWRVEGEFPDSPKFVLIVAPHTSNWDFVIGVLAMFAVGLRASWLGKHSVFRFPLTPVFRWLGGEPVDRSAPHGTVGTAVDHFRTRPQWVLALSPEGTRRRVDRWKTGFYRIAVGAGVPIVPVTMDYGTRVVGIGSPVVPGSNEAADLEELRGRFRKEMARYPEKFAEDET
jgi:1-acyl-sn-glycerol-3-phosphate acyltransferase